MKRRPTSIQTVVTSKPFDQAIAIALAEISSSDNTRAEYRRDVDQWLRFCGQYGIDPQRPADGAVAAWVEHMKKRGDAPKSRARRMSSLSSVFRELRRKRVVAANPFSIDEGPRREKVSVVAPTRLAQPADVAKVLAECDQSETGRRDAAIIRVLWSTGMRRVSLLSMTVERLLRDRAGYVATVTKKGGDTQRVLITGKAYQALELWLDILEDGKFTKGPVWLTKKGTPMSPRELNRMLERRAKAAGADLSPHMLRVSFLTFNPAGIEAKQDAAGHSDPATTRLYDRAAWRGREAFEQMPDPEEVH